MTWLERIPAQTDALMRDAETMLKGVIQPPATSLTVLTNVQVQARNQYNTAVYELFKLRRAAERDGEFFDPTVAVETVMDGHVGKLIAEDKVRWEKTISEGFALLRERNIEIEDGDITKMAEIYWLDEWSKSTGRFYNDGRTLMRAMEAWNQLNADQAVQLER